MKFVDEAFITVVGGKGGDGCISFHREKFVPKGGPDGGDGGEGGSVWVIGDQNLQTLADFEYKKFYKAEDGENGKGKNKHGKKGKDLMIKVPLGTDLYDAENNRLIGSILKPAESLIVAKGGRGGRGNACFATPTRRTPLIKENGEEGERKKIKLVLRLLADVGIVGLPNAGKSTLLKILTHATPKIADYPFTTLTPNLGVFRNDVISFTTADIPGLVKNAHKGKGLGLQFLRHIERTKFLLFLLDTTQNPLKAFEILKEEIQSYNPDILKKPRLVLFNKIDLLNKVPRFKLEEKHFYISALRGDGVEKLKKYLSSQFQKWKEKP